MDGRSFGMGVELRLAKHEESKKLEDFLVEVTSEKNRKLAQNYIKAIFSSDFRKPNFLVMEDENKIIGSAAYSEELFTTSTWGISWVAVDAKHRHKGYGQKLVEACCNQIKECSKKPVMVILGTYPDKTRLYEKCGFKAAGQDYEGGWYMLKYLEANI
jgi:N-acetylglutamate synthase-like GNAT family acetyltransferase